MKALKISFDHGRVWTAETSDGKRATGASLQGVVEQLLPLTHERQFTTEDYDVIADVFNGIRDSGGSGLARHGQVSG